MQKIIIPADVPHQMQTQFLNNYNAITKNTDHLFLFSCDQKIEHLHDAFNPDDETIDADAIDPEHLFKIANLGSIGAMATQLALIARYGTQYPHINYIAKLNSKTNLIPIDIKDPKSSELWNVQHVLQLKQEHNLNIRGVGVTIYPGSEYEDEMMHFASHMIFQAHQYGLVAIIWMYPRGKAIKNDTDKNLLAGVAGAANALGADFVKIKSPHEPPSALKEIVAAAGNTKVLCAGGIQVDTKSYLQTVYDQLHQGNVSGTATGRNIFQHNIRQAIAITHAIHAIVYENASVKDALKLL